MTAKEAAQSLIAHLAGSPNFVSALVGSGDPPVLVALCRRPHPTVPSTWNGFTVRITTMPEWPHA